MTELTRSEINILRGSLQHAWITASKRGDADVVARLRELDAKLGEMYAEQFLTK